MTSKILIILIPLTQTFNNIESNENFESITIERSASSLDSQNDGYRTAYYFATHELDFVMYELCSNGSLKGELNITDSMYDELDKCRRLLPHMKVSLIF